jgi:site-specific recombinase XerD
LGFSEVGDAYYDSWLLGHVNIATTAIYTHLTEPTRVLLRDVLDKAMNGL